MDDWELFAEHVSLEISPDMYQLFLNQMTDDKLKDHEQQCLKDERYENLILIKKEKGKRKKTN